MGVWGGSVVPRPFKKKFEPNLTLFVFIFAHIFTHLYFLCRAHFGRKHQFYPFLRKIFQDWVRNGCGGKPLQTKSVKRCLTISLSLDVLLSVSHIDSVLHIIHCSLYSGVMSDDVTDFVFTTYPDVLRRSQLQPSGNYWE